MMSSTAFLLKFYLHRQFCHHVHVLNSAALALAGIDASFQPMVADHVGLIR